MGCVSGTKASHTEANAGNLNRDEKQPALLTQNTAQPAQDVTADQVYKVVRVVDGDTVIILIDGKQTRVRLIGVDTPETVHPQKPVEAFGKEASQFTKNLLEGESVYLGYEVGVSKLDKYGRSHTSSAFPTASSSIKRSFVRATDTPIRNTRSSIWRRSALRNARRGKQRKDSGERARPLFQTHRQRPHRQ
jgi:hypothetical protein